MPVKKTLPVKRILPVGSPCRLTFLPNKIFGFANRPWQSAWTTTASPALTSRMRSRDPAAPSPQSCPERSRCSSRGGPARCSDPPPRTFAAGPPKTSTEMSRVVPVPGGAADDHDWPADNPRPSIISTKVLWKQTALRHCIKIYIRWNRNNASLRSSVAAVKRSDWNFSPLKLIGLRVSMASGTKIWDCAFAEYLLSLSCYCYCV